MSKSFQFGYVLNGIAFSLLFILFSSAIYGTVLFFTSLPESPIIVNLITFLGVFGGGFFSAYKSGTKGLYYGLAVGIGFFLVSLLLMAIFRSTMPSWLDVIERLLLIIISGGIGGICGVFFNTKDLSN